MKKQPLNDVVSILMPFYNAQSTLQLAVQGVLQQTYRHWELILLSDGSADDSVTMALEYAELDSRIRFIHSSRNRKLARARNLTIRLARGKYLAFCDADDVWEPQKLACQIEQMQMGKLNFSYTGFCYKNFEKNWVSPAANIRTIHHFQDLLKGNSIGLSTVVIDAEALGVPYFDRMPGGLIHEDYAFWLKVFRKPQLRAGLLNHNLVTIGISDASLSANKWLALKSQWLILGKYGGCSPWGQLKYSMSYLLLALKKRGLKTIFHQYI